MTELDQSRAQARQGPEGKIPLIHRFKALLRASDVNFPGMEGPRAIDRSPKGITGARELLGKAAAYHELASPDADGSDSDRQ